MIRLLFSGRRGQLLGIPGIAVCSFLVWGCASSGELPPPVPPLAEATGQPSTAAEKLPISRGDTLEVFVKEDPSLGGEYVVREGGDIIIAEVGRISLAGLSLHDAERKIEGILEQRQLTAATVILDRVGYGTGKKGSVAGEAVTVIYLSGKVNRPGKHAVPLYQGRVPGIYEAILICGGLARFADDRKITLLRPDEAEGTKARYTVNLAKIVMGEAEDFPIADGDILIVPEKSISL